MFVKSFYINIILKACLLKTKVWFYNLKYLLRYKDKGSSIKVTKLIYKYNLIFIKLKSLFIYLSILLVILTSIIKILISLIIKQLIKHSF